MTNPKTLNVSHDLRAHDISQNMKPGNPGFNVTPLLNDAITIAMKKGYTKITGEPGEYYFHSSYNKDCYVYLDHAKKLSIDFPGSTFNFKYPGISAFQLAGCHECELTGMAIDYEILPFTQLWVRDIDLAQQIVIVEPMEGYPNLVQLQKVHAPYATEYIAFDIRQPNMQPVIQYAISGTHLMLQFAGQADRIPFGSLASAFQPGDLLIVTARGGNPAINVTGGGTLTIKDVAVYTSGGVGIDVNNSNSVTLEQVTIAPRPRTTRQVSVVAGGIALNDIGTNNAVRNCTVTRACDDSIAGHANPSAYTGDNLNLVIVGNEITDSLLARGIGFTSVTGVHITQNTIVGTQQAGIMLGGATYQMQPQAVTDAQITHNKLRHTNVGPAGVGSDMLGAIEVMYYNERGQAVSDHFNRRIYINNNEISTTLRSGVWLGNVDVGMVKDNFIYEWGLSNGSLGLDDHLNDGLRPCAPQLFTQATVGWYNQNVRGVEAAPPHCLPI